MDLIEGPNGPEHVVQASYQVISEVLEMAAANAATTGQQKAFKKIGTFMDKFVDGLDNMLGPSPRKLRDAEFIRLTDYCKHDDKWREYGKRPRTLALLRWLGCPEAIEGFVQDNMSDIALPYTERNLPRCVRGQERRTRFLELQHFVLTNQAADLERPGGRHLNIERSAQKYFDVIKPLGSGGFGTVDHVVSRLSLRQYALKRISRGQSFARDRVAIRSFENELKSLKDLSHKHLVKLIGSYTDQDHIGLIITPVADMNLEEYLSAPKSDCPDRENCLRHFFGCLAAGVEYLHSQKIRHKDIKPKNVLVLRNYRRVLLTDFGTAHNWSDDPGGSTSGTVHEAFTERYCAPEVFGRKRRNEASDIWSLGCIFLEMSTVLSDLTVRQMQEFFQANGNGRHFIRENPQASEAWCQKISKQLSLPADEQVLDLGSRLCHLIPLERPTAAEIASEIVDFRGPIKYHCGCCELKSDFWTNLDIVQDMQNMTRTEEWTMEVTVIPNSATEVVFEEPSPINESPSDVDESTPAKSDPLPLIKAPPPANYQPPSVREIQENMTVMYYDAEELPVCRLKDADACFLGEATLSSVDKAILRPTPIDTPTEERLPEFANGAALAARPLELRCDWPQCSVVFTVNHVAATPEPLLLAHCRNVHGCHEFSRTTSLLQKASSPTEEVSSDSAPTFEPAQLVNYLVNSDSEDADPIVERIRRTKIERRERREQREKEDAENGNEIAESTSQSPQPPPKEQPIKRTPSTRKSERNVRFSTLPEDRRPETTTLAAEPVVQEPDFDPNDALEEPLIEIFWPFLSQSGRNGAFSTSEAARPMLPAASFVPSFHLGAANRFFGTEISSSSCLFVYGTLMFPSILKACAEHYVSEDGVYSSKFQRRLRTSPSDWGYASESLQSAAERMTPAVISGFARGSVKRRPWAFLSTPPQGGQNPPREGLLEVHGFAISGLSAEAYRCLDHWHNEEMPSRLGFSRRPAKNPRDGAERDPKPLFSRGPATVYIEQDDQKVRQVNATVFWCHDHRYDTQGQSFLILPQWDVNAFLRSCSYTRLCRGAKPSAKEERRLANTMKIRYLMRGDVLCSAVLRGNRDKVMDYVDKGYDVNAKCHTYGTALQAAAAKSEDDMAMLLIEEGADVNESGGRYKTPLIAAVIHGREELAKQLLRNKANVLAPGGQYINALYQSVSFSDIAMSHLLLEKGAWLSENYLEILDVAAENGNRSMIRMLEDYDVRSLWKKRLLDQRSANTGDDSNDSLPYDERRALAKPKSLSLVRAVLLEAFSLKGQRGKWTGIKAVRLLQTAIRMGASERIIDRAAPFLSSYERLVEVICEAGKQQNEEKQMLEDSGRGGRGGGGRGPIESSADSSRSNPLQEVVRRMTSSLSSAPSSSRTYTSSYHHDRDRDRPSDLFDPSSDVFCLTCGGRGGRTGTERTCNECNGTKTVWKREGTHSKRVMCPTCLGRGYTYSSRDVCRACSRGGGADSMAAAPPQSTPRVRFADDLDAPPPYTP